MYKMAVTNIMVIVYNQQEKYTEMQEFTNRTRLLKSKSWENCFFVEKNRR